MNLIFNFHSFFLNYILLLTKNNLDIFFYTLINPDRIMINNYFDTILVFLFLYGGLHSILVLYPYFKYIFQDPFINPFLCIDPDEDTEKQTTLAETIIPSFDPIPDFQHKYLTKYKALPNQFIFTQDEIENEHSKYQLYVSLVSEELNKFKSKLYQLKGIELSGGLSLIPKPTMNEFGIQILLKYLDMELDDDEYDHLTDDSDEKEEFKLTLLTDFYKEMEDTSNKITELTNTLSDDTELKQKAREFIINKKLDNFIHNYVLETTPLGNVFMRYNNEKKSFEYFSNNTIPYRFLEAIARKYVITYQCKPIFVDIEEELKRAEEKYDEDKLKEQEKLNQAKINNNNNSNINNNKDLLVKLKNYNKDVNTSAHVLPQAKNRNTSNFVLPPQIKANLPNTSSTSDKHLLKENANRYTWEGRLSSFNPLQTIDKKLVNKTLSMSFADFKKKKIENNH